MTYVANIKATIDGLAHIEAPHEKPAAIGRKVSRRHETPAAIGLQRFMT